LGLEESSFDPSTTLSWADIKAREDGSFLIHIKNPAGGGVSLATSSHLKVKMCVQQLLLADT